MSSLFRSALILAGLSLAVGAGPALAQNDMQTAPKTVPQAQPAPGDATPQGSISKQLSNSKGVITPAPTGDKSVVTPPPTGPQSTPVIPPPGAPGGTQKVEPK